MYNMIGKLLRFIVGIFIVLFFISKDPTLQGYVDSSVEQIKNTVAFHSPITAEEVPPYSGNISVQMNDNIPYFSDEVYLVNPASAFEYYGNLDSLGRCTGAEANVGKELTPKEKDREDISEVKPSGWWNKPYDFIDNGGYLYNRCHLIAYMLTGENANEKNLITGTRYFNTQGMLPYEIQVSDYVNRTGNHVLYRVIPVFKGNNLVANGVLMEAYSLEDDGQGLQFCVFVYNVQPGVTIDYADGNNWESGYSEGEN